MLMNQVLIDENVREVYNIYGDSNLSFDPRNDETRLLASTMFTYFLWLGCSFIFTLPESAHSSRVWITIVIIILFVLEAFMTFGGLTIPPWFPLRHTTEYEVLRALHLALPLVMGILRSVAQCYFVDMDSCTATALAVLIQNNKVGI
jgi:hypothetical protein